MPYQDNDDIDRRNDMKLLTPLLVMALIRGRGLPLLRSLRPRSAD